jgi:hypothetical protein
LKLGLNHSPFILVEYDLFAICVEENEAGVIKVETSATIIKSNSFLNCRVETEASKMFFFITRYLPSKLATIIP